MGNDLIEIQKKVFKTAWIFQMPEFPLLTSLNKECNSYNYTADKENKN